MRRGEWERFDRHAVDRALRLLGCAILACAAADARAGAWRVHAGELFPWRHLPGLPLYGRVGLALEWAINLAAGAALLVPHRRSLQVTAGVWAGALGAALGLSQRFSNHRALLFLVLVFVGLAPPRTGDHDFATRDHPNLALVRAQLLVVYGFSALHKVLSGFLDGASLASLFAWPLAIARPAAWGVVLAELAVPTLLLTRPRLGLPAAVALHVTMAALLPSVWPFSFVMVAMAFTFVYPRTSMGGARIDAT